MFVFWILHLQLNFATSAQLQITNLILREVRFKKVSQSVFFHKTRKSTSFLSMRRMAMGVGAFESTDPGAPSKYLKNIYFWALEKLLEASEVEESIEKWENLKSNFKISRWIYEKSLENVFFLTFKLIYASSGHGSCKMQLQNSKCKHFDF